MNEYPSWLRWVLWLLPIALFYLVREVTNSVNIAIIIAGSALAFAFFMDVRQARRDRSKE